MKWLFFLFVLLNISAAGWYGVAGAGFVLNGDPVYAPPVSQRILMLDEESERVVVDQSELDAELVSSLESEMLALSVHAVASPRVESEVKELEKVEDVFCPFVYFEKDQEKRLFVVEVQKNAFQIKEYRSDDERQRYWVYIHAPEKKQDAIKIVGSLKGQGVDSFVINRGEMKNRISLGLYSTQTTANTERARIAKLSGLEIEVYEHLRKVPIMVVEFLGGVTESQWQKLISGLNLGKMMIKLEKKSC